MSELKDKIESEIFQYMDKLIVSGGINTQVGQTIAEDVIDIVHDKKTDEEGK